MKKSHFILLSVTVFLLFLAFSVYRYFEIKEQGAKEPVLYDLPSYGVGSEPRAGILRDHLVDKKIRRPIIKNKPDSDRSQCSKPPLVTQKIRTRFAGYILEYPCTVRSRGTIHTYFDEQGDSDTEYKLYFGVVLNNDESVWKLKHDQDVSQKPAFRIILTSNGRYIERPPLIKRRDKVTQAHENDINGLTLYRNKNSIVGYLEDEKDASGNPPAISCSAGTNTAVKDVFSLLENPNYIGTYCSAGWALTEHIYLYMPHMTIKSKDAYQFKDIYRIINSGVRDSIVSNPLPSFKFSPEYPMTTFTAIWTTA